MVKDAPGNRGSAVSAIVSPSEGRRRSPSPAWSLPWIAQLKSSYLSRIACWTTDGQPAPCRRGRRTTIDSASMWYQRRVRVSRSRSYPHRASEVARDPLADLVGRSRRLTTGLATRELGRRRGRRGSVGCSSVLLAIQAVAAQLVPRSHGPTAASIAPVAALRAHGTPTPEASSRALGPPSSAQ